MEKFEVKNLTKYYDNECRKGVFDVSLKLKKGKAIALVGESGCGKTTLVNCITGLLRADKGEFIIDGNVIHNVENKAEKLIEKLNGIFQIIFQNATGSLNPAKMIFEIYMETLYYMSNKYPQKDLFNKTNKNYQEIYDYILSQMKYFNLEEKVLFKYNKQLSGGQIQKACLVRALLGKPEILIADEPTCSMDVTTQAMVLNYLKKIVDQNDIGLLLITHNIKVAEWLCEPEDIIEMDKGKIINNFIRKQSLLS